MEDILHLGNEGLCSPLLRGSRSCNKSEIISIPTVSDFTCSNDDKFHVRLLVVLLSFSSSTSSSINPSSSLSSSLSVLVLLRSPGKCLYIAAFFLFTAGWSFPILITWGWLHFVYSQSLTSHSLWLLFLLHRSILSVMIWEWQSSRLHYLFLSCF